MKNILVFRQRKEIESFIRERLIRPVEFHRDPFFSNLIQFIIDQRAPIFITASKEEEYAHFSAYFNLVLIRDSYTNPYIEALYYLHDFVHMLFWNPLNPRELGFSRYQELTKTNEYAASNDSEILSYYRLPEIREHTFAEPILYDLLKDIYPEPPSAEALLSLRRAIIESDAAPPALSRDSRFKKLQNFYSRFSSNNNVWAKLWYEHFPKLKLQNVDPYPTFSPSQYQSEIINYTPTRTKSQYQASLIRTLNTALALLNIPILASSFKECFDLVSLLEGKLIMPITASAFHRQYISSINS